MATSPTVFKQWLLDIGKSERTANSYSGAINSALSLLAKEASIISENLYSVDEPKQLYQISQKIQKLDIFKSKNDIGKGMYSAALNKYVEFLEDITKQQLGEDIEQILADDTVPITEKSALINTRLGQGKFRNELIKLWQGCAVTGYSDVRFLVASHIKPWRASSPQERITPYNGLLLLPNLDKVFDLGYITFSENGDIQISEHLENHEALGISTAMSVKLSEPHQEYMAHHRQECFLS